MARSPYPRSDRDLISRIGRSAGGRAGYKQLIRELGLGGGRERRLLLEQLTRMVARGELLRVDQEMWAVPRPDPDGTTPARPTGEAYPGRKVRTSRSGPGMWAGFEETQRSGRDRLVSGRLDLHRDGFGFVRAEKDSGASGATGDIFIPPNEINGAMQGDQVLVDEAPPARDGRRSGRIARVLTRRNPTIVGIFRYARAGGRRGNWDTPGIHENVVHPIDERLGGPIVIPAGAEVVTHAEDSPHRTLGDEARAAGWETDSRWPLEGLAVDVEVTAFPSAGKPARGRVIEVLGPPDAFGVDVEIVIRKHHIPHTFPAHVLAEARERAEYGPGTLDPEEQELREDFRGLPIVTIDGETARDFDDAVLVRPLANGHTELQVHIADVSDYVLVGSLLDTEARMRGTSVYFPDRAVPMLPHELSSGMCSLLPNEDRLVLSCIMEIDARGDIVAYRLAEGIIRSVRRCTYTTVQHCLNAGELRGSHEHAQRVIPEPSAEDLAERERIGLEHPYLPAAFDAMLELALRLNAKRVRRGSIDFDLPEPIVQFDPDGNMKAIVRSERGWSHRLIEEFMLSANECVAHWLEAQGIPSIYRIHETPDPKRVVEFEETASQFGQSLGIGNLPVKKFTMKSDRRESRSNSARGRDTRAPQQHEVPEAIPVTPQMYQKLVRRISGHAEERILAYLMLRSLKQARYAEKNEGHFALASPAYTHFTSPIRRYPDLIVHRLLRAMLRSDADPEGAPILGSEPQPWGGKSFEKPRIEDNGPMSVQELEDIASESSQSERRAADAERELIEWKKMKFMADKIGDDFQAVILSVTKYGFFVELHEMFIEGLVPITSLVGDHYTFRDTDRTIVGARTGHVFDLGQRVEVVLDRIDRQQRRLQFALLPGTEPIANTGAPAPGMRRGKSEAKKAKSASGGKSRKTKDRTAKKKGSRKKR
ncbi:RNAse R [Bryocella elongata]|uniref:Ribonuclease R n=1 Tax=Bryocella elongata TaxID=863522 RepID=A0A1H6BMQ8_9BACT|nr:RNB domain-containing ribonuclease [Bryocella elongata]SEG61725.1 RNAse R [Bryocella elongata]